MIEKLDDALKTLTEMAIAEVEGARARKFFSKDFAEAVCIVFSMAYSRFQDGS